jgi:hypothetical protein
MESVERFLRTLSSSFIAFILSFLLLDVVVVWITGDIHSEVGIRLGAIASLGSAVVVGKRVWDKPQNPEKPLQ